jgi:hypothetical protein|tara:strand:+ start:4850 stop:5170 length:321 start_codon:yes stop_codon:yes gene_type:complete
MPSKAKDFINVSASSTSNIVKRSEVQIGQVFQSLDSGATGIPYAHTGTRTVPPSQEVRYGSINCVSREDASGKNGNARVRIIGEWVMGLKFHEDFADVAHNVRAAG